MQLETPRPVLGVHAAQGQTHPQTQVGWAAVQRGERALVRWGLKVGAAELLLDVQLLHGGGHAGHAVEVLEALLAEGPLAEGPEVGQLVARDAAAAVRDADGGVLGRLGDCDLDGSGVVGGTAVGAVAVDDGLYRVAQELADDVLEVAEDVGEAGLEMALDADVGDLDVGRVGGAGNLLDGLGAGLDDRLGVAFDEDFADEVGLGELGAGGEVGGVVCFGEGEVLFGNDTAADALDGISGAWSGLSTGDSRI